MRRGIAFTPMETRRDVIVEVAVAADGLGYETVAVPEGWGFDSTVLLTEIALRTTRIRPMSAILPIWSRTPAAIAMSTATLADVSDGRYILGLGVSTPALAEGLHDVAFDRPMGRLERAVGDVRTLLAGDRLSLASDARPLRLAATPRPDQEIVLATSGPRGRRLAAERADGWYPMFVPRDRFASDADELRRLRAVAGVADDFTAYAIAMAVAHDDPREAERIMGSMLAWYLVAMGDGYPRQVAGVGYAEEVAAVAAANPRPRPDACVLPPEAAVLMDQFTVHGTPDSLRHDLEAWDAAGDVTLLGLPPGQPLEVLLGTLRAGAPTLSPDRA